MEAPAAMTPESADVVRVLAIGTWLGPFLPALRGRLTVAADVHLLSGEDEEQLVSDIGGFDVVLASRLGVAPARAAHRLRFLQVAGAGVDRIALTDLAPGVVVANCYEHERGIAEYVLMQCLALSCALPTVDSALRRGDWRHGIVGGGQPRGELGGRTIGIVGFGRIGREVARLARAFDMRVVATTPHPPDPDRWPDIGVDWVGGPDRLLDVLASSDFVVVCAPLNEATQSMIGRRELEAMRPSAFLINPSRGPVVDESALYEALRSRAIRGAAIDTWYRYPVAAGQPQRPSDEAFEELDNVIMTPHIAGYTADTMDRRMTVAAANISAFMTGGPIVHRLDRERS